MADNFFPFRISSKASDIAGMWQEYAILEMAFFVTHLRQFQRKLLIGSELRHTLSPNPCPPMLQLTVPSLIITSYTSINCYHSNNDRARQVFSDIPNTSLKYAKTTHSAGSPTPKGGR
jgi:hypothetical protein